MDRSKEVVPSKPNTSIQFWRAIASSRPSGDTSQVCPPVPKLGGGRPSIDRRVPPRGSRRYQPLDVVEVDQSRMQLSPLLGPRRPMWDPRGLVRSGATERRVAGPTALPSKGARI